MELNRYINNKIKLKTEENMIVDTIIKNDVFKKTKHSIKAKVLYGYDPLCGWCYGFSNELKKVINQFDSQIDFELVNGGLFSGIRGPKMGYMSAHIKRNMKYVTDRTGKEFGPSFIKLLDKSNYLYNSMKPSIAVEVMKDMSPEKVFDFASEIQTAFFYQGRDIHADETFYEIISDYKIDKASFIQKLNSSEYELKTKEEFLRAQKLGFSGYPSSIIKTNEKMQSLTHGFVSSDEFAILIQKIIN